MNFNQTAILNNIVQFIVDVYIPSFFQIYLHPSALQSPANVLKIRTFMKACSVSQVAKKCFLDYGENWLNPSTAALGALHASIDVSKISTIKTPDTRALLWSNQPLSAFLNVTSAALPCLTTGSRDDWEAFKNSNISCERLIERVKETINGKKIHDTDDVVFQKKFFFSLSWDISQTMMTSR